MTKNNKNTVVCILGMRSGSSMITRLLNICGLQLGEQNYLLVTGTNANKKGYWENTEILRINNKILELFDGTWSHPPIFPEKWEQDKRLDNIYKEADDLILYMNEKYSLWGFKEPRTALTLPFWQKIIPEMKYIVIVRSPLDVAISLYKRDGMDISDGMLLWFTHMLSILNHTKGEETFFTFFDNYFIKEKLELEKVINFIENEKVVLNKKEVSDFISHDLRHNKCKYIGEMNNHNVTQEVILKWLTESFCEYKSNKFKI
jgi:hypothetical protein